MRKTINSFTAAAVALAFVLGSPAAWAGSVASVSQSGDGNYAIVYQNKNKTRAKSWTASTPGEKVMSAKKVNGAVKQATRYKPVQSGKLGGRRCGSGIGGVNNAYAGQTGFGNKALVKQVGTNNVAATFQNGNNNASYIIQKGSGHEAYVAQNGNDNVAVIVQRC